jgi:adenine/guanine phosphoribosyltransferase-like PRPP-binding protein
MAAAVQLAQGLGAQVAEAAFVVELGFLGGRARLGVPAASLLVYD